MDSRKWEIITALLRLSHTVEAGLTRHLAPFGIAFTDLRLMLMVLVLEGVSQKELATQMGVSQVVVSTRLEKLERLGLVTRSHVGHRRVSVTHTESGTHLLSMLLQSVLFSAPVRAMDPLTSDQVDQVLESVRVLVKSMRVPSVDPSDVQRISHPSSISDVLVDGHRPVDESCEEHLAKEQDRLNLAFQGLETELGTLVQAFKLLQKKSEERGGDEQVTSGSAPD